MPAYDDVQFAAVRPEEVRLGAIGDQPALVKPALYGIAWPGGIGRWAPWPPCQAAWSRARWP